MWFRKEIPNPDVEERLAKLERAVKDLQLDWEETYEKFRMLLMRLSARERRAAPQVSGPPPDIYERG